MKKSRPSLDGFIPRQARDDLGHHHDERSSSVAKRRRADSVQQLHTAKEAPARRAAAPVTTIGRSDISESLRSVDEEEAPIDKKASRRQRRRDRKAGVAPKSKKKRIIKWIAILIAVVLIGIGAYVGIKALIASGNVFSGNVFDVMQKQPLKQDENGRSNFVIFGTAEDDEGGEHGGALLTDSIMILSVNQTTKDAFMVSIPRDLWVEYGQACPSGYQGKINEVFNCYSNEGQDEPAGAAALQKKAGEVLGLDIQYYVHLNFTAVTEAVDAVGGVTVTIESNPKGVGILDRNFDWKCGYKCYYVKYEDGQVVDLDGEHALALARARNANGGYGLQDSNFDREKNQQKIIKSLREKAVSAGTLTNVGKVTGLIDALGNNLRTNIETKEIQTIMGLANDIQTDAITSLSLNDKENPIVTTGNVGTQSVVRPVLGLYNYSGIRAFIAKHASSNEVTKEAASIVVLNASGTSGVAQTEADYLEEKGFTIGIVDNAPQGTTSNVAVYQVGEGNSATAAKLKELYGLSELATGTPPVAVDEPTKFVIVLGKSQNRTR